MDGGDLWDSRLSSSSSSSSFTRRYQLRSGQFSDSLIFLGFVCFFSGY